MSPNQRFIVVFKKTASQEAINQQADEVSAHGGEVKARYNSIVMKGFAAEIPEAYLLALQNSLQQPGNEIDYIEPDQEVRVQRV